MNEHTPTQEWLQVRRDTYTQCKGAVEGEAAWARVNGVELLDAVASLSTDRDDLVASNADLTVDYESARQHIRHQQEELDKLSTDRDALLKVIKNRRGPWPDDIRLLIRGMGGVTDAADKAMETVNEYETWLMDLNDAIVEVERGES